MRTWLYYAFLHTPGFFLPFRQFAEQTSRNITCKHPAIGVLCSLLRHSTKMTMYATPNRSELCLSSVMLKCYSIMRST